nr:Chain C, GAG PROTEIN [Human immunodeficiency virus 1]2BVQ_C Chain C, HIV-P24 [Human immunodeficiency virus]2YPK_C Chain C, KF11 P24 GAG PEPTIDE [Human immunodeficiency virus]2YPL_C Chain C, KF11 P24 GAG PEPTIDE [Human immunodeficiency virus]
KAFSPEVIPMF